MQLRFFAFTRALFLSVLYAPIIAIFALSRTLYFLHACLVTKYVIIYTISECYFKDKTNIFISVICSFLLSSFLKPSTPHHNTRHFFHYSYTCLISASATEFFYTAYLIYPQILIFFPSRFYSCNDNILHTFSRYSSFFNFPFLT